MRLVRTSAILTVVVLAALLLMSAVPAQSAPAADGSLADPGFEAFTKSNVEPGWNGVPNGWTPWWNQVGDGGCPSEPSTNYFKPNIEQEMHGTHVHGGSSSARVWVGYHVDDAGLYQQVSATAGTTYQFSAWAFLWSTSNPVVDSPSDGDTMTFQVGLSPSGGTDPGSATWSGGENTMDHFAQQSVSAVATSGTITVFVRTTSQYCVARNDAFFDDAALVATATGPAPAAPGAKPTPVPSGDWGVTNGTIVTSTPAADGSITHTVGPGQTCIGIALAYNVDYDTFLKLNSLSNATCKFIYVGQKLVIKPAGSSGTSGSGAASTPAGNKATQTAAAAAAAQATDAATDEATQVAAASQTGTVCVLGYDDKNNNGLREPTEPNLAGMTFTVTGPSGPVANHTTDTSPEPYCFTQLAAGNYTIQWTGDGLTPSAGQSASWQVTVSAGSSASHNFGAVSGDSASSGTPGSTGSTAATGSTSPSSGPPTWLIALIGAFGVILFMGGLGVAGYFLLLRRTNI